MTALAAAPPVVPARLHRGVVAQALLCAIPSMALLALGSMYLAAYCYFALLGPLLVWRLAARKPLEALALTVGLIPLTMLLRGLVFYNSLQVMLAASLVLALANPADRARLLRHRPLLWLLGACIALWLASFIATGEYTANSRMVELGLAAACVYTLCGHRSYLATAAVAAAFSALAMAAGLLPYGARLGIASGGTGLSIGNPITLGLSAAIAYLLTVADRGRWLLLHRNPVLRTSLGLAAGAALLLSTSRGSWLVTLFGLLTVLVWNPSARRTLWVTLALYSGLVLVLLQTERGASVSHYFENAVGDDRSLDKRTTGRANQWEAVPAMLNQSPLWGFGPGSSRDVSRRLTREGKPWHSLYLLLICETGLLGLSALFLLFGVLAARAVRHLRFCGEVLPLMALVCFLWIGVSVSGIDAISGVFLGFAFTGGDYSAFRRLRIARVFPRSAFEPLAAAGK